MKMCETNDVCFIFNLGNKNLGIYCHLSLLLRYFWCRNCLKTSILLFWATLVNTCWPYHMCVILPNEVWGLVSIYLKSLPPKYHVKKSKTHRGGSSNHFFCLRNGWWNNHLHINFSNLHQELFYLLKFYGFQGFDLK